MAETSIDRLTLDIVVNNENAARRINNITKAIEKLNTAMGKSGNIDKVLDKINNVSPTSTRGGSTSGGGSKRKDNVNIFATLGKWNYMINMARYYGRSLANIVQLSMDYVETQNLWQVANRNNLEMAEQFIQKMNKAYGVSEATLMNYQAIFKNMLSALGDLSDEISSGLSMQLTQMALDFSSLYNVTIPSAMQKFQAVLSGQVRPIRSVSGYDITENTIFDLYAGAGGEKTMRQLSQIEKRLLRIVAVFDQMGATGATGDMAKTIESASNQARIMNEQFKETMTWAGQILLIWLDNANVLQYINAGLITAKNIMKAMAENLGYSDKNFLDGLVTTTQEANDAVDELQGKLLSIDKFEALNSNQNALGIDQTVLDLVSKINYETGEFQMKANELAETWTKLFIDPDTGKFTELTNKIVEMSEGLLAVLGVIAIIKHPVLSIITALSSLYITDEKFRESVNVILNTLAGLVVDMMPLIKDFVVILADVLPFVADVLNVLLEILKPILSLLKTINDFFIDVNETIFGWLFGKKSSSGGGAGGGGFGARSAVPQYATGGFPEDGLFFANSGEMVGGFSNGRTAVANNDQIVTGITQGVYSAMMAYNAQTRGQSGAGDVYLDGTKVGQVVAKGSHSEMVRVGLIKANS